MRKWISLAVVVAMSLGLVACGNKGESGDVTSATATAQKAKDFVYNEEIITLDMEQPYVEQMAVANDKIYITNSIYHYPEEDLIDENGIAGDNVRVETIAEDNEIEEDVAEEIDTEESISEDQAIKDIMIESSSMNYEPTVENIVMVFDLEGNKLQQFSLPQDGLSNITGIAPDKDGNINITLVKYPNYETEENPKERFYLINMSETGEENWNVELGTNVSEEEYYYVNSFFVTEEGKLVLGSTLGIEVYNGDGSLQETIKLDEADMGQLFLLGDGSIASLGWGEVGQYFKTLDWETKKLSEPIDLSFNTYNYSFYTGFNCDLYMADNYGVYSYNFGDEKPTQLMNYIDSDINTYNLSRIVAISDTEFYANYYGGDKGEDYFAKFTKVPPEEVPDTKVLNLACLWLDSDVKNQVVAFNKINGQYRITIEDYSQYNTNEDYTVGTTKLNTDIVSGKVPDIMLLNMESPVNNYISKGILEDLNPYFENDTELKKEDYLTNILDIFSDNGKLYQIVPEFNITTIAAKTADVGSTPGWTMDDLNKVAEQQNEEMIIFPDMTRSYLLQYCVQFFGEDYIDWETGKCSFNTDGFKKVLEYAKGFPEEINYEAYGDEYWMGYQSMYRDGKALLSMTSIPSFREYNYLKKGTFGEDITLIGFPSENGNGSSANYNVGFGISAKSENKDGAWEFIRYFLTDEYQDEIDYNFPIKLSSLEKQAQLAMEKPFYIDEETGEKVEYDDTYYVNDQEIVIEQITQEEISEVMNAITSLTQVANFDADLLKIIEEESASYFSGQKNVNEVADIIQSRVQIYVNENR